jgi:hypothetical protein
LFLALLLVIASRKIAASIKVSRQMANPSEGRRLNAEISSLCGKHATSDGPIAQTEWSIRSTNSAWESGISPAM